MKGLISLKTPHDFRFWPTVQSHGWCTLPPFSIDPSGQRLFRVLMLPGDTLARCTMTESEDGIRLRYESAEPLTQQQRRSIRSQASSSFRLGEDLGPFHNAMRKESQYRWIMRLRAGRLLRAPTVFEDLLKMICTTNCTWGLTTQMTRNIVDLLGPSSSEGWKGFPEAATIAGCTEQFFRTNIRAGYRSPYLIGLAEAVASGHIDPEQWRLPGQSPDYVRKELLSITGIGPYAAENMLRLLGHYEYTGLDTWVRGRYYELYHDGRKVSDRTISKRYARFGRWAGLVFWLEMTREWYDSEPKEGTDG